MQLKCLIFLLSLWKSALNMPHLNLEETYFYSPIFLVLGYSPMYPYYQLYSYNFNYIKNQQTAPTLENKEKEEKTGFTIAQGQTLISFDFRSKPETEFGKPSTDSPGSESTPNLVDRLPTTELPSLSLNYQTMEPNSNIGQTQPDESNSPDTNDNNQPTPTIIDRLSENSTEKPINEMAEVQRKPTISLEYKPMRPFYAGTNGFSIGQIVQPGQPWPSSPEGYQTFSQTTTPKVPDIVSKPNLDNRVKEPNTTENKKEETINIEYKPMRPFFAGENGFSIGQIVQPGLPWPDSEEGYQNFSQTSTVKPPVSVFKPNLDNRVQETGDNKTDQGETANIEYKPMRPFFAGNSGFSVGQIVPPGKPWPGSAEDYQNFSQTTASPNLGNRVQQTTPSSNQIAQEQVVSLEYKPMRPSHYPKPTTVAQVVSTGKPWPVSLEGYQNFTEVKPGVVEDRFQESSTSEAQAGFIWEEDVIVQPGPNSVLYTSKPGQEGAITTEGALYTSSILEGKAVSETGLGKLKTLNVSVLPLKMPFISVAASNDE